MNIVIIGLGRMGVLQARIARFLNHSLIAAIDVSPEARAFFASYFTTPVFDTLSLAKDLLATADLVFLTVTDAQIENAAISLSPFVSPDCVVVHTSGALSSHVLQHHLSCHVGSVHPLMACPLVTTPDCACVEAYRGVFHVIEGDSVTQNLVERYISAFGGKIAKIDVEKKALYHASAVFASNYPVTLADTAQRLFCECGFNPQDAREASCRLLESALALLRERDPVNALTGPVKRHDTPTIQKHLSALTGYPDELELYRALLRATENMVNRES